MSTPKIAKRKKTQPSTKRGTEYGGQRDDTEESMQSGQTSCFPLRRKWRAQEGRFENERSKFNFATLSFDHESENHGEGRPGADDAASSMSQTDELVTHRLDLEPSRRSIVSTTRSRSSIVRRNSMQQQQQLLFNSGDFSLDESAELSAHLDLEPSQRIVSRSRNSMVRRSSIQQQMQQQQQLLFSAGVLNLNELAIKDVKLVGRDSEVQKLVEAHNDAITRMVVIIGESGSGKTMLAREIHNLKKASSDTPGIFCSGKFDFQNRADPYLGIVAALDEFVSKVLADVIILSQVRDSVKASSLIEKDTGRLLEEVLPSFSLLMEGTNGSKKKNRNHHQRQKQSTETAIDRSITDRGRRIQNAFVEFLRIVSTVDRPLTILLDDIQWCGPASLALVDALLRDEELDHFFLVATCRSEYLPPPDDSGSSSTLSLTESARNGRTEMINRPLLEMLTKHSTRLYQLHLGLLDLIPVYKMIKLLLRMDDDDENDESTDDRVLRLAKIVHQKTNGNPFFVLEFMRVLVDEELVSFNASTMQWIWMEIDILSLNVADNVAQAVHSRLQKLPKGDLLLAQVASCISQTVQSEMLRFVLSSLQSTFESQWEDMKDYWPTDIDRNCRNLEEAGVFESPFAGEQFDFSHDQIQSAAFNLIPDDRKVPMQLAIGKRLISGFDSFNREQFLFTSVELCGVGMKGMDQSEKKAFAFWAFLAGESALRQGAFQAALTFFEQAATCLGNDGDPFQEDADLALPVFSGAAEAAFCVSEFGKVALYVSLVKKQEQIPMEKRIRVALIELKVCAATKEARQGVAIFRETIKTLGCGRLPAKPGVPTVLYQLFKTVRLLKRYNKGKILGIPQSTDPAISAALGVFAESILCLYIANPNLFVVSACKAIKWSLLGVTKNTPHVLSCFAAILVGMNDNTKALELGETALELCDLHKYNEALPYTIGTTFGFVRHWSRPMQQFESPTRYAIDLAMRLGQVDMVSYNYDAYAAMTLLTQRETLQETIKELQGFCRNMHEMKTHDKGVELSLQFALKISYPSRENTSMNGDAMSEEGILRFAGENSDIITPILLEYFRMMLLIYFGEYVRAAEVGKLVIDFGFGSAPGVHYAPRNSFMIGFANVLSYHQTGKSKYLRTARWMQKRLKTWVKSGNPNVPHLLSMLNAELYVAYKDTKRAVDSYNDAIVTSQRVGYKLDFAMANQRFALFHVSSDYNQAQYYMKEAVNGYSRYGADGIVSYLKRAHRDLIV